MGTVEQADLISVFTALGLTVVRSRVFPDTRGTGCSSAMVQVSSIEEAATAIQSLHGQDANAFLPQQHAVQTPQQMVATVPATAPTIDALNMPLTVKYAGQGQLPCDNLYLTGLPSPGTDEASLKQMFTMMGLTVVRLR